MQLKCLCANLMICSLKFKWGVFLKMLLGILCFCFWSYTPPKLFFTSIMDKTMDQLLLFFLWNFSSYFRWRWRCPRNLFSQFVIDRYILAIQQIITHTRSIFAILFLICSNLLNRLRSHGTKAIKIGSG